MYLYAICPHPCLHIYVWHSGISMIKMLHLLRVLVSWSVQSKSSSCKHCRASPSASASLNPSAGFSLPSAITCLPLASRMLNPFIALVSLRMMACLSLTSLKSVPCLASLSKAINPTQSPATAASTSTITIASSLIFSLQYTCLKIKKCGKLSHKGRGKKNTIFFRKKS